MNQVMSVEVADFVEAVDAALADLPADVRAELLEDLPAHLADVVADGGTPVGELGEPAAYAAELRAAAGHPSATVRATRSREYLTRLRRADARVGSAVGYARLTDLAKALQPTWWLLRGYLVLLLLTGAWGRTGHDAVTPIVYDSVPLGFVVLVGLIAASVWIGRRTLGSGRAIVIAVSTVATLALVVTGANVAKNAIAPVTYSDDSTYQGPLGDVTNIYPYGPDGKVENNVRLVDQDGNPITVEPTCDSANATQWETFPIVCDDGTGSFDPSSPIAPLPSEATRAGDAASTPATSTPPTATTQASAPATTPAQPIRPTATPAR